MKNERTPRTLADAVFPVSYPAVIPTRRSRLLYALESVAGWAVIVATVIFTAWVITGA